MDMFLKNFLVVKMIKNLCYGREYLEMMNYYYFICEVLCFCLMKSMYQMILLFNGFLNLLFLGIRVNYL